jgi:phospholipid/cholesterol/gamma-HCH transport system ATP-binding protein
MTDPIVIKVHDLVVGFDRQTVLDRLCLDVRGGEILGVVGARAGNRFCSAPSSAARRAGTIEVLGVDPMRRTRPSAAR